MRAGKIQLGPIPPDFDFEINGIFLMVVYSIAIRHLNGFVVPVRDLRQGQTHRLFGGVKDIIHGTMKGIQPILADSF